MKWNFLAAGVACVLVASLLMAATLNGYLDIARIAAPSNPAAGSLRLYANSSSGDLACLDSSGGDCLPGGGGGGAAPAVGTFATVSGAACTLSQLGLLTDSVYSGVCITGPSWRWLLGSLLVTPPASSGWTWTNQGGSTAATSGGALLLTMAGSPGQWRQYMRAVPMATPFTVYLRFSHIDLTSLAATLNEGPGVCFGDGSGKFEVLAPLNQLTTNIGLLVEDWTNTSSFAGGVTSITGEMDYPAGRVAIQNNEHFRLVDDGTNLTYSVAVDGRTWVPIATVSRTAFFAAGPTTYGICWRSTTAQGSYVLVTDDTEQ